MFQFSRKGISVGRAVPSRPRNLFAYGWRATFDSRGGRWCRARRAFPVPVVDFSALGGTVRTFDPRRGRWCVPGATFAGLVVDLALGGTVLGAGRRLMCVTSELARRWDRWWYITCGFVCLLCAVVAWRRRVACGGRRRVFALDSVRFCGVDDPQYTWFHPNMGGRGRLGVQLRRSVAVV